MFNKRLTALILALGCLLGLCGSALAAEVDCDGVYCFSAGDFSQEGQLMGICITELPDTAAGTVLLGRRVLRPGDILTTDQISQMTFSPLRTEDDRDAVVTYLPIYADHVAQCASMTIAIRGKEDQAPVAQDLNLETYKNLPAEGSLKITDPEGQPLTYTVLRQPRRGEVSINTDGTFTYTPKKNKVGTDSFTVTAADPAGNVSREATVTIQIIKPTSAEQYTDTLGQSCRFAAEWLRQSGIFEAENVGGESCFYPEKQVSQGEFLAMVIKTLDIPTQDSAMEAVSDEVPHWLKPYVAAAIRSGLLTNLPEDFDANGAVSAETAAVLLQNALDLTVSTPEDTDEMAVWAESALTAMADNGITLTPGQALNRADAAQVLYQVSKLSDLAPGMQILRMQRNAPVGQ
jgi:VCBS repeat-containing protein